MFKFGLKLWSVNDNYFNEALSLYEKGFFDFIELYVVPDSYKSNIKLWKSLNIPFLIHAPHYEHGFNLSKNENEIRNIEIYEETKAFANELNAEYIIFHGGIGGDVEETVKQLKSFNEPRVLIENKPQVVFPKLENNEICRGYNISEIKYIMDCVDCGFCFDFGHAICSANSQKKEVYLYLEEFLKLKPEMFHLTDIKDINSVYDSHEHFGEGELNLNKIFILLSGTLFDNINITIETKKNSKTNLDDFIKDINFLYKVAK